MLRNLLMVTLLGFLTGCDNGQRTTGTTNTTGNPTTTNSTTTSNASDSNTRTTPTVLDQNENKEDVDRTAEIRKKVVDANLSTRARNVKIITKDGQVTLTGTVDTAEEKSKVEEIAKSVASDAKVESLLEVKAPE